MSVEHLTLRIPSSTRAEALDTATRLASHWFDIPSDCISARIVAVPDADLIRTAEGAILSAVCEAEVQTFVEHDFVRQRTSAAKCARCGTLHSPSGPHAAYPVIRSK